MRRKQRWLLAISVLFLFAIMSMNAAETAAQIWQVGNRRWSVEEERRFAAWVEDTVDEKFFLRRKIPVDCADAPYGIRWIYSRIAGLPAAVTTPEGQLLGHWSPDWDQLPTAREWYRDRRFLASLSAVLESTSTKSIPHDSYPIRISPDSLTAGAIFFYQRHSGIVGRIVTDGSTFSPIQTWEATLPRRLSLLHQRDLLARTGDPGLGTGILRFRWPVFAKGRWHYLDVEDHPYYSLEQYQPDFVSAGRPFEEEVMHRMDPREYPPEQRVRLLIDSLYKYLLVRADIVRQGYQHCRDNGCPAESVLWEEYSTPDRDGMIDFRVYILEQLIARHHLDRAPINRLMDGLQVPMSETENVSLRYVVENHEWLSHDPGDSIEARWGLAKCDMIRARTLELYDQKRFAEDHYRAADPEYADRRREIIRHRLGELAREAGKVPCRNPQISIQPPLIIGRSQPRAAPAFAPLPVHANN